MSTEIAPINTNTQVAIYTPQDELILIKKSNFDADTKSVMLRAVAIRFSELSIEEKISMITTEMEQAFIRNGSNKDEIVSKAFTISEIVELFSERKQITHKEISHIFKLGSLGLYGKFFGINVKSIHDWIEEFYADEKRKLALRKLNELKKAKEAIMEITPAEKESLIIKMTKEIYHERKQNGFSDREMLSYPVYDILKTKGLINLTAHQKQYLLDEAQDIITSFKNREVKRQKMFEVEQTMNVTNIAKVLAVRDYFNELAEQNLELPL